MGRSSTELKDKAHPKRKQSKTQLDTRSSHADRPTTTDQKPAASTKTQPAADQASQAPPPSQQPQLSIKAVVAQPTPNFKLVVNKPQAIVIDLLGVLVCRSFMSSSKEFRDFFQHNVLEYINDSWKQKQLKIMINFFRCSQQNVPDEYKLADREDPKEDQIKQAKKHVIWKLRNDPTNSALSLFMLGITEWGYKTKLLQTQIYEDVPQMLKFWKDQLKIPVYVGVGSADFLVMVLSNTCYGNLLPLFNGHMNIMDFDGMRANKDFRKLANLLRLAPDKILYLTRFRADCRRAMETGMQALIVLRPDFDTHGLIKELKARRTNAAGGFDATRMRINNADDAASPPNGKTLPDPKNPELKNQFEKNISTLSLIDDHEETDRYNTSSQIVEQDLTRYNIILSLSEIAFK